MDRHVWGMAKGKVVVSNGKIVSVSEPPTKFYPVNYAIWGTENQDGKSIKRSMELRIDAFGLCTPERIIESEVFAVGFGA